MANEKLKWMYEGKNSSIDHEEYLLGKKITTLHDDADDKGDFLVKSQSSVATGNVTVLERLDYESKVREDPLFEIRKNDYEHRKELLSNPFKKKRIQTILKNALEKDLRRNCTKQDSASSSTSETDSDLSSSSEEWDNRYSKKSLGNEKLRNALKKKLEQDLKVHRTSSKAKKRVPDRSANREDKFDKSSCRYGDGNHEREKDDCNRASPEKKKEGYGLMYVKNGEREHRKTKPRKHRAQRTPSPEPKKQKYARKHKSGFSRKLTEKELERKRMEMMDNATWRDEQRKDNVERFANDEKKEKEHEERVQAMRKKIEGKGGNAKDFLHDMKLHSVSVGSIEDTVRRKKHTLRK